MSLIPLLFATTYFWQAEPKPFYSDSVPLKANVISAKPKIPNPSILKKMEVFAQANFRLWRYKFPQESNGKFVGMFCNKISPLPLKDTLMMDTLVEYYMLPFFEDCIFNNRLQDYSALCFCFTPDLNTCFEVNPRNRIYTYQYQFGSDTMRVISLPKKAALCAAVLGQDAVAELYKPGIRKPGEIVLYFPVEPNEKGMLSMETHAIACARLVYIYLLTSKEAEETGYTKVSICYYNKKFPLNSKNILESYTYDKKNSLFADL